MGNLSDENAELKQFADELIEEGIQHIHEGKLKLAEKTLMRAKGIFESLGDKLMISKSLNLLSIVYDEMGNESMNMDCLLDSYDLAMEIDSLDYAARSLNNVGSRYMNAKAYDQALVYFKRAEDAFYKACEMGICKEEDNQGLLLILNLNLAAIYSLNHQVELCRKYYEKAKAQHTHPDNYDQVFTFQAFEGLLLWRMGDKDAAMACVDPLIESARATEYAPDYLELMAYLIDLLKEMNDYERWENVLKIMETRLQEDGGLNYKMELQRRWLEFFDVSGNTEAYQKACVDYYKMSKEKEAIDFQVTADTISLKIEMRRTEKQKELSDSIVYVDSLTGIGNRNKMLNDSLALIEESYKNTKNIGIGLIDIDYFKECNDTYGHIKGDECLKQVATTIADTIGEYGRVYRYGGDEFLILVKDITSDEITELGKQIKENIAELKIPNVKSPICPFVTLSQGYTIAFADEGDTIDTLVNLADQVLYSVKRCGRNNYKYIHINDIKGGIH